MRKSAHDTALYRGPVRKRRIQFGAPSHIPVPISRFAARTVANTGIVARYAPTTDKALKKYNVGRAANAIKD